MECCLSSSKLRFLPDKLTRLDAAADNDPDEDADNWLLFLHSAGN